jgi:hypothetical protein
MKMYRALAFLIVLFGCLQIINHFSRVEAQAGLPFPDTCSSERATCVANYNLDLQQCITSCGSILSCRTQCRSIYQPELQQCASAYSTCISGRDNTCVTYCGTVCGGPLQYSRYDETSGPKCQCACGTGNACGGTPLSCGNGTATCQYDSSSGQFGYVCPQCYGTAPSCAGGPNGLATCQNNSAGFGQYTCPTSGCSGSNSAPVCGSGTAVCTAGTWSCPSSGGGGGGGSNPPPQYCTDPANPLTCTACNPINKPGCNNPSCVGSSWECNDSPILIDVKGQGFHLTSAPNGVLFDFNGDGLPIQIAWTDPRFSNAWLALDRNGNGRIDDATELFGNLTPQPKSSHPNGFIALAEFDKPENGGNGDGFIDAQDEVYSKLRLWIDSNHDGASEPQELHTLSELGVVRIELEYHETDVADRYGNLFRYKSRIWDDRGVTPDRWTYDVFLQQAP